MINVFDRANYPAREPDTASAGDRWVWRRDDLASAYPIADYELFYRFTSQSDSDDVQEAFAIEADETYYIEIESGDSEIFSAETYAWEAVIIRSSDATEAVVDRGYLDVSATSTSSHTLRVLNAIRATIEGTASEEHERVEIAGRALWRRSISELTELEAIYARRWASEKKAIDRAAGRAAGKRVLVKMRA